MIDRLLAMLLKIGGPAVWPLLLLGLQILRGWGCCRMAAHAGLPRPWLGWLPLGEDYLLGRLAERAGITRAGRSPRFSLWLPLIQLPPLLIPAVLFLATWGEDPYAIAGFVFLCSLGLFFSFANSFLGAAPLMLLLFKLEIVPAFGLLLLWGLALLAAFGLARWCDFCIYRDYAPKSAAALLVLAVFLPCGPWLLRLLLRNVVPVSVTGAEDFPCGRPKYDRHHGWSRLAPRQ